MKQTSQVTWNCVWMARGVGRRWLVSRRSGGWLCVLPIARKVRATLSKVGLDLRDALVDVRSQTGNKELGEHDMVMVIVADCQGEGLQKYLSVEINVRRLWSEAGKNKNRLELRKECSDECEWWQQERGNFSGRLVCMACFTEKEGYASMQLLGTSV